MTNEMEVELSDGTIERRPIDHYEVDAITQPLHRLSMELRRPVPVLYYDEYIVYRLGLRPLVVRRLGRR